MPVVQTPRLNQLINHCYTIPEKRTPNWGAYSNPSYEVLSMRRIENDMPVTVVLLGSRSVV